MTLDDLLPFVLPFAKGCPEIVAYHNLRLSIAQLCTDGLVWREYQTAVLTVDGQTAYAYTPAAGQRVVKLLSLKVDGSDVDVLDPKKGKEADDRGDTSDYAYGTFTGFELRPARAAGKSIVTYSAVAPSLTSTTIPDAFERYAEEIGHGALARILAIDDEKFSNPAKAEFYKTQFETEDIPAAAAEALKGFARSYPRTKPSWF